MSKFVVEETDSVYQMMKKLETFITESTKPKYNLILDFINHLFSSNYKMLTKIKNLSLDKINYKSIRLTINKYKTQCKKILNIDFDKKFLIDEENKTSSDYIKNLLRKMLRMIDHTLKKNVNNSSNSDNSDSSDNVVTYKIIYQEQIK